MMQQEYLIGVMITPIEDPDERFREQVVNAVELLEQQLTQQLPNIRLEISDFVGPHLIPANGAYSPLDLLQLGVIEKVERTPSFLLVVTEVEIAAEMMTYATSFTSPLTNVAILSTKRLDPGFWGDAANAQDTTEQRLVGLMLHTIGLLLNLPAHNVPQNIMYRYEELDQLSQMRDFTENQLQQMARGLPAESRDLIAQPSQRGFIVQRVLANMGSIWRTVRRSNPVRLAFDLTTMIAAAFSLIIVIFFSPEMWDIGSTVELYQFVIFSLIAIIIATLVIYRAYPLRATVTHTRRISESLVVTNAATLVTLFLTMIVLYTVFWVLVYLGIITFFPRRLMETWPTVDPAVRTIDHIKISTFIAAMGTLVGSLGGHVDHKAVMRRILFLGEDR